MYCLLPIRHIEKENNSKQCFLERENWQNLNSGLKTIVLFVNCTSFRLSLALKNTLSDFNELLNLVGELNRLIVLVMSFFTF